MSASVLRVFKTCCVSTPPTLLFHSLPLHQYTQNTSYLLHQIFTVVSASNLPESLSNVLLMARIQEILLWKPESHYSKMIKFF